MTFNAELARKALARIEAHPEEWEQGDWRCGTAYCFAGHVALAGGWKWEIPGSTSDTSVEKDGEIIHVEYAADRALGLEHNQGWRSGLFSASNTLEFLRVRVEELASLSDAEFREAFPV